MSTINIGSSLPTGSNLIGNVKLVDTAGTNQLAIDANNNAHVTIYNATNAMAIDSSNNAHVGVWNGANQLAINSVGNAGINVVQIAGSAISLGSKTSANSIPVVVASDQAAISIQHGNSVDTNNSSTATLTANSVFTGTSTSSLNYSTLSVEVFADQVSATNGLSLQQSQNGTNWDTTDTFTVSASTAFTTVVNLIGQFYRIVYTNGTTNQGTFRLQTIKMVADAVLPRTLTPLGNLKSAVQESLPTGTNQIGSMTIAGVAATDPYNATVFVPGELRVSLEATQLFMDSFDTGLDTTNKWKSPSSGGGGVAATNVVSDTVLGTGTTANGYSYLESQITFPVVNPGWLHVTMGNNIPSPYVTNTYFFWGTGTSPTTPTAAAPLTDASGFEVALGGKMYAVMYQGGTRNVIQDLSSATGNSKQPTDALVHYYTMFYRGDRTYWTIDGLDNVVASTTTGAPGPNVNTLPLKLTAIAGTSAPASSGTLQCNTVSVGDTARNAQQISDGTYPWRKATVTST